MKKTISYTDSASKKLDKVISDFKKRMEEDIIESKNYPGEEIIEITASDIENTYERVRIYKRYSRGTATSKLLNLLLPTYFFSGIIVMLYGLFNKEIKELISNNPEQLSIVLMGFVISLTTGALYYLRKQRENERKKEIMEKRFEKFKQGLSSDLD